MRNGEMGNGEMRKGEMADFMDEPGHSSTVTLSGTPVTSQTELANVSISR